MNTKHTLLLLVLFMTCGIQMQAEHSHMTQDELHKALIEALQSDNHDVAKELLQAGADIDQTMNTWETIGRGDGGCDYATEESLFCYAARRGDSSILKGILKIKYGLENLEPQPIKQNSSAGIYSYIRAMIAAYMSLSKQPEPNHNIDHDEVFRALKIALHKGHLHIIEQLLQIPGIYNDQKINFWLYNTALVDAAEHGCLSIVKELVRVHANINYADEDGRTALIVALKNRYLGIAHELIRAHANVNSADKYGDSPLIISASEGCDDEIRQLIQAGADVNHANKDGDTALMRAIQKCNIDAVQAILESKKININHANNNGDTAPIIALDRIRTSYIAGDSRGYNNCINSQRIAEIILSIPEIDPYLANKWGETVLSLLEKHRRSARY